MASLEFAAVMKEAAPLYVAGRIDLTIRDRLMLTLAQQNGRFKYKMAGSHTLYWDVKRGQRLLQAYGDDGVIRFERSNLHEQLNVNWRGYKLPDRMTEKQRLMLGDLSSIINRYDEQGEDMLDDMQDGFCSQQFVDGYAAGNENKVHGLESFLGERTAPAATDRIAEPGDTYGSKNTNLADVGGSWSTNLTTYPNATLAKDWPDGSGTADYDYMAPKLVNYSSSNWGTGSTTWEDNCERALDQTIIWMTHTGGRKNKPTAFLLASDLYYAYQNKMRAKYRLNIPHQQATDLGFPDTMQQSGVMVAHDFDVDAGVGYGISMQRMAICSLYDQLFVSRGPTYDIHSDSYLWLVGFFGNNRYEPKGFAKLKAYA